MANLWGRWSSLQQKAASRGRTTIPLVIDPATSVEGTGPEKERSRMQNDVLQVLMDMRNGAVATDINSKFNEMIGAVLDTAGKGELTITIKAEPSKMGLGGAVLEVSTEHACKMKKPELAVGKSFFFVTRDGQLTRDDPAQSAMFSLQAEQKEKTQ
jgi:hypothetical protein